MSGGELGRVAIEPGKGVGGVGSTLDGISRGLSIRISTRMLIRSVTSQLPSLIHRSRELDRDAGTRRSVPIAHPTEHLSQPQALDLGPVVRILGP